MEITKSNVVFLDKKLKAIYAENCFSEFVFSYDYCSWEEIKTPGLTFLGTPVFWKTLIKSKCLERRAGFSTDEVEKLRK